MDASSGLKCALVGVDAGQIREIKPDEAWPLSPAQRIELAAVSNVAHLEIYFRFRTIKEVFMKGAGLVMALLLHDFDMSRAGPKLARLKDKPAEPDQ